MTGDQTVAGLRSYLAEVVGEFAAMEFDRMLAAAEQRGAERVAVAIDEVLRDPATSWWHTGGTQCVPARAIRARLADQGATP